MNLLREKAHACIRKLDLSFYAGRLVACDATLVIKKYNFKIILGYVLIFSHNLRDIGQFFDYFDR